jgi:hypothetical protein
MAKYKYGKKRIKCMINTADAAKSWLQSMNSAYWGWQLADAMHDIHQNIMSCFSSIPKKFTPEVELMHYQSGDMYNPGMLFGLIKLYMDDYSVVMRISESDIELQLHHLPNKLTRSRYARYKSKAEDTRLDGETPVPIERTRDAMGVGSFSTIYQ